MARTGIFDRSGPSIFRRNDDARVFSGAVRKRIRDRFRTPLPPEPEPEPRHDVRNEEDEAHPEPRTAILTTPWVPSVEEHKSAVEDPITGVEANAGFSGAELRVRNYIIGIAESAELPLEVVQDSEGVKKFADSISVDVEKVKFKTTDE